MHVGNEIVSAAHLRVYVICCVILTCAAAFNQVRRVDKFSNKLHSLPLTKIRVCTGSSCISKCQGVFNPFDSFNMFQADAPVGQTKIEIEEVFCMNQCKKGPNARIIKDGFVLTFNEMNDLELARKSFHSLRSENRTKHIYHLAIQAADEKVVYTPNGDATLLGDILPS